MPLARAFLLFALLLVGAVLMGREAAQALPPAGTDRLPVVATAQVGSRLGSETITLTGWAEIVRQAPHTEGNVGVVDMELVGLHLQGVSQVGVIAVVERPNQGASFVSEGEIRSLQTGQDFPASSFFEIFADVTLPANPTGTLLLHNQTALHLQPRAGGQVVDLTAWPPLGVVYELDPIFEVDNDGDTQIDEDSADDDRDGLTDEDRAGADPDTPGGGTECGNDPDCDGEEGEDPPIGLCTLLVCDDDSDGSMDEDPDCVPLLNSGNVNNKKSGQCLRELTLEFAPETPTFSVERGGPSGLHPADLLALTPIDEVSGPPPPPPVDVSGNDPFGSSWAIPGAPFAGQQDTSSFTTQPAQCGNAIDDDGDTTINDGCPALGVVESGAQCANNTDDDGDTTVNDGCPTVSVAEKTEPYRSPYVCAASIGKTAWYAYTPAASGQVTVSTAGTNYDTVLSVYSGSVLTSLTPVACDDDEPPGTQSLVSFFATAGTTYRIQIGSWANVSAGTLKLDLSAGGVVSNDEQAPFVRIPCANLGLSADGCDTDSDQDDLDALSFGTDFQGTGGSQINFSVGPGAQGATGTAVRAQTQCPPGDPGAAPEPEPDEFSSLLDGSNSLVLDGNGPIGTCPSAFPLNLVEGPSARDNLDALDANDPFAVDPDNDGIPESNVYFSLDPLSPSLGTLSASDGDILKTVNGGTPTVYASRAALGLQSGDDVDALCLQESGNGTFTLGSDVLHFSLAPGSPTLAAISAGPGDLLVPGSPPAIAEAAASLGLGAGDDLDAAKCLSLKDPNADPDGDGDPNSTDPDDDNDSCLDTQELDSDQTLGGRRNPHNFWDFFDTHTGGGLARDGSVSGLDIFAVIARFNMTDLGGTALINRNTDPWSTPPGSGYHPSYDRGPLVGSNPWNVGHADGAITGLDIFAVIAQFNHTCA